MSKTINPRETLWGLMTREERMIGIEALWNSKIEGMQKNLVSGLAETIGFREVFIRSQKTDWKLNLLEKNLHRWPLSSFLSSVMSQFLIKKCSDMIRGILDAEGTPRDDIIIMKEASPPSPESLMRGIRYAVSNFNLRDVCIYYDLHLEDTDHWRHLGEVIACDELTDAFKRLLQQLSNQNKSGSERSATPAIAKEKISQAISNDSFETGFTVLDRVLIYNIVGCAAEAEGALTQTEAQSLIDEVIALAPERHRSHFHSGFLDALLGVEIRKEVPAGNAARRSWCFVGYLMGIARNSSRGGLREFILAHKQGWEEVLKGAPINAQSMLFGLVPSFISEKAWDLLPSVLTMARVHMDPSRISSVNWTAFKAAANLVQSGQINEAIPILEATLRVSQIKDFQGTKSIAELTLNSVWKLGQAHLKAGRFEQAKAYLSAINVQEYSDILADIKVDLALANSRFRSIEFLLPGENAVAEKTIISALEGVQGALQEAVDIANQGNKRIPGAHFILGVISLYRGDLPLAEYHLNSAQFGMIYAREVYGPTGIIDWVHFLLGIIISEQCQSVRLNEIRPHVEIAIQSNVKFPLRLWRRLCRSLSLYDDLTLAEIVARHVLATRGDKGLELLKETGLIVLNASLRKAYREWLLLSQVSLVNKAKEFEALLDMALVSKESSEGIDLLDVLEGFARTDSACAERFLVLVAHRRQDLLGVWTEEDIDLSVAALLEGAGRITECLAILRRVFYRTRLSFDTGTTDALLSHMERLGMAEDELAQMRRIVSPPIIVCDSSGADFDLAGIKVLYVGGNEIQKQYEEQIRKRFAVKHPMLSVSFYYPGWSSNWNVHIERVTPLLHQHDVVVIHRFVRTQFGRTLRSRCGPSTPWRSCTGTGRQSIEKAIEDSAIWSKRIRESGTEI